MTTMQKAPPRPVQLGKLIVDIAPGQVVGQEENGFDPGMSELGRQGGPKGGPQGGQASRRHYV